MPAFSAGPSGSTRVISTPNSSRSLSALARSLSTSWMLTPMKLPVPGVEAIRIGRGVCAARNAETLAKMVARRKLRILLQSPQENCAVCDIDPQQRSTAVDGSFRAQRRPVDPENLDGRKLGNNPRLTASLVAGHDRQCQVRRNQNRNVTRSGREQRILNARAR